MQIEMAVGEFAEFAEAASDSEPGHGMVAKILEQAAGKIAHIDERVFAELVMGLNRGFRGTPCGRRNVPEAERPRDVNAAMDRMDP